jgi:hypothetical protein
MKSILMSLLLLIGSFGFAIEDEKPETGDVKDTEMTVSSNEDVQVTQGDENPEEQQ